jgi:hypothetical protein
VPVLAQGDNHGLLELEREGLSRLRVTPGAYFLPKAQDLVNLSPLQIAKVPLRDIGLLDQLAARGRNSPPAV